MARILTLPYDFHLPDEGDPFWGRLKAKARQIEDDNLGEHRTAYTDEQAFAIVFEDDIASLEECLAGRGWGYCTAGSATKEIWGDDVEWEEYVEPPAPPPVYMDGKSLPAGARFRVVKEGARLLGMVPEGGAALGYRHRVLEVGQIIECKGYSAGWGSDPGYGYHWIDDQFSYATFAPSKGGSPYDYGRPEVGYLQPVTDDAGAA